MVSPIDERSVLIRIVEGYKEYRCLWDTTDPAYHNKDIRNEAFTALLSIYHQARPNTTLKDLKKKLDNMRTTWKMEAKKVKDSLGTGAVYVPTLWYYELMMFMDEKEVTRQKTETLDDDIEAVIFCDAFCETVDDSSAVEEFPPTPTPPSMNATSQRQIKRRERSFLQKRQHKLIDDTNGLTHSLPPIRQVGRSDSPGGLVAGNLLINTIDDDWDVIGKSLGVQLKQLCSEQRIIAQKLIADTLFYGNLKKLNVSSCITLNAPLSAGSSSHFTP